MSWQEVSDAQQPHEEAASDHTGVCSYEELVQMDQNSANIYTSIITNIFRYDAIINAYSNCQLLGK